MALIYVLRPLILKYLFGAIEADVENAANEYFMIIVLSVPFIALYNSGAAILRTIGNSRLPMQIKIAMNILSVAGNALLVLVFHMGVAGVVIPTPDFQNGAVFLVLYMAGKSERTAETVRKTKTQESDKVWTDYIGRKASSEDRIISIQIPDAILENIDLSTTNEDISLSELTVMGSVSISSNGGNIYFESLNAGDNITLTVKNGDITGRIAGSYDDYAIQSAIKKGDSNLPSSKEGGEKTLNTSCNNGNVTIVFQD